MEVTPLWGLLGVALALGGLAVLVPEVLAALGEPGAGPFLVYAAGVLLAALATAAVVVSDLVLGE